jgi:hypothetical protein
MTNGIRIGIMLSVNCFYCDPECDIMVNVILLSVTFYIVMLSVGVLGVSMLSATFFFCYVCRYVVCQYAKLRSTDCHIFLLLC